MEDRLVDRPEYVGRALMFRDRRLVKVVTGLRRCGKSSLLELVRRRIETEGAPGRSFVTANLEDRETGVRTADDLYEYCRARMGEGTTYLFLDEVQRVPGWHDAVNSLRVGFDCDIYLTGSNAFLLSGDLATYLSGRYVEVRMLPLIFAEYVRFCGLRPNVDGGILLREGGDPVLADDLLARYLRYGGLPALAGLGTTQGQHAAYLSSLYESVILRDILDRERNRGARSIRDPDLLRLICGYLADNVGRPVSANGIAKALRQPSGANDKTVASYIRALNDAYVFYPASRYDLHGKAMLRTLPKQYIVDLGLRSYLAGYRPGDYGSLLENAVYLQLLHEGYAVSVGKLYQKEVDFVCERDGRRLYVQVTDDMSSPGTIDRELSPLLSIRDGFEKMVVVRQGSYPGDVDGVRIVSARRFFLGLDR